MQHAWVISNQQVHKSGSIMNLIHQNYIGMVAIINYIHKLIFHNIKVLLMHKVNYINV